MKARHMLSVIGIACAVLGTPWEAVATEVESPDWSVSLALSLLPEEARDLSFLAELQPNDRYSRVLNQHMPFRREV